jgi:hypothetical protein
MIFYEQRKNNPSSYSVPYGTLNIGGDLQFINISSLKGLIEIVA